jgi:hypothetical protein
MTKPDPLQEARIEFNSAIFAKLLKGEPHIKVALHPAELVAIVAHVQLALRHPEIKTMFGTAAELAEETIKKWIKKLPIAAQSYLDRGL